MSPIDLSKQKKKHKDEGQHANQTPREAENE